MAFPHLPRRRYVMFYVNLVANQETISLLFHLAMKGKTVQDAESEQSSEVRMKACLNAVGHSCTYGFRPPLPSQQNFYVLCDMAQELLKAYAQHHSWNIQSYPGKVKLPSDILRPHPSAEAANRVRACKLLVVSS